MITGENIKYLRNERGWDQNDLADMLTKAGVKMAQTTISSWERLGFPLKKRKLLNKVAEILETTPVWLTTHHSEETKAEDIQTVGIKDIIEIKSLLYEIRAALQVKIPAERVPAERGGR